VAGFLSIAFAFASLLFLWTLLTALWGDGVFAGQTEAVARRAFGCGIALFSLLLIGSAVLPVPGLFLTSAVAVTALLASYLATSAEGWAGAFSAPDNSDFRAAARVMAAGAAHGALLTRFSGRSNAMAGEARS
jgi:hypothetical protein